jgi:hypothetical protein
MEIGIRRSNIINSSNDSDDEDVSGTREMSGAHPFCTLPNYNQSNQIQCSNARMLLGLIVQSTQK